MPGKTADVIEVESLVKRYGSATALAGVSLAVGRGEIFGLLGQNGAGKTTLVKILLGMVAASDGSARLLGMPVGTPSARRGVGYLPEDHRLPEYHTASTLLDCYGGLQGLPQAWRRQRADELIETVGLGHARRLKVRSYSKGMKQRLGLAQALLHRPDVLFLDEPTDGVDPVGRKQIRDLLLAERDRGVTIFINSHLLGEVEQLCDRVAILRKGELVRSGRVADLTDRKQTWLVGFDRPLPSDMPWTMARVELLGTATVSDQAGPAERDGLARVHLEDDVALDRFLADAAAHGLAIRHLQRERRTLEDLYLELALAPRGSSTREGTQPATSLGVSHP
jgi:ABC-2 type transport system ATP-binding protein